MELQKRPKTPLAGWATYWFTPAPLFNLAICRTFIVGFQLFHLVTKGRDGYIWERLLEHSALPNFLYKPLLVLQLLLWPFGSDYRPSLVFLGIVYWLTLVTGILSLLGLRTNLNLIIFAVANIFIQAYLFSFGDFHHSEALVILALSILALSPAGGVLSIDDLRHRIQLNIKQRRFEVFNITDSNSTFAKWPLLLIQWLFAIIYLDSAINKLHKGGLDWMNGYTLQYYLWQDGLRWDRDIGIWFAQQHTLALLSSWVAIFFEATFFLVLIFPKLIWLYIPMGAAFHTGIYLAQKADFLKYIFVYSVFIPWVTIAKNLSRHQRYSHSKNEPEIIYDGQCPLCIRSMTILCYFDWFNRLNFSDVQTRWSSLAENYPEISMENCLQEMHLILPDGSIRRGFSAFREILWYLPPFWPLLLIFYFPLASPISSKIYRFIISKQSKTQRYSYETSSVDSNREGRL